MTSQHITLNALDGSGSFTAYLALPPSGRGPGIVLAQEIFGVNATMRQVADQYAEEGYVVLVPDLFWRQQPGIQLTDQTEAEWARAFELFNGFDLKKGVDDLNATIETLRKQKGCTGKVGTVGFCLGGRLAYLTATRTRADAAVSYYGVMLTEHVKEPVEAPLMLHIATEDEYVPKDQQAKIHAALKSNRKVTIHDYKGQNHAFARVGGKHFDKASADLARKRTLDFFKANLG